MNLVAKWLMIIDLPRCGTEGHGNRRARAAWQGIDPRLPLF